MAKILLIVGPGGSAHNLIANDLCYKLESTGKEIVKIGNGSCGLSPNELKNYLDIFFKENPDSSLIFLIAHGHLHPQSQEYYIILEKEEDEWKARSIKSLFADIMAANNESRVD